MKPPREVGVRQGRPRTKGMARSDWERVRTKRFNELLFEVKDGTKDRDRVHAILDQELPESLVEPDAPPTPPLSSKRGRPRKQCGHPEWERKAVRKGKYISSFCAACKRERAQAKWARTHKRRRVA